MPAKNDALPVVGEMCSTVPFLEPLAFALLDDVRAFFRDPANEAEYQEWRRDPEAVRRKWERQRGNHPCA